MLIGLGYKRRRGKDTAAAYLIERHGFQRVSWADILKAGVNTWHGWDDRHGYGELKEVIDPYWGYSPREAYQKIGTDLMRNSWRQDFWVMATMRKVEKILLTGQSVVIADVRFPNEADAVRRAGGAVINVTRPGMPVEDADLHPSETSLDGYESFNYVINNDGSISDLHDKVESVLLTLRT